MTSREIKDKILEKYPDIEFKNLYFLDDEAVNEYSIDTIALKLSQLTPAEAFKLSLKLSISDSITCIKPMIKYIIDNNIDFFKDNKYNSNADTIIIDEYARIYGNNDFTVEELKEIEKLNINNNKDKNFNFLTFDINYYNELIIIQKLYKERKIKYNDIKPFIEFTFELLKNSALENFGNYDSKYDTYINEIISHILIGNITPSSLFECMNSYYKITDLIMVSKFGKVIYELQDVKIDLLGALKGKQINNIYNEFINNTKSFEKLYNDYSEDRILLTLINMSTLLGYDNVIKIIRHLPKEEIKVIRLLNAFKYIDLSKVRVDNNEIKYNNEFINFFMGNNLNEPNSLLNLIYDGKTVLADKIESIYSFWDILSYRYKDEPLNTRLAFLERDFTTSKVILNPDEYKLEGSIVNSYYDNRKFQNLNSVELIEKLRLEYSKMKHNYQKTIPYVNGEYEGYYYETVLSSDPNLFMMGSSTDNCFKIGGDADSFVRYCAHDVNGRVLAIKDKKGKIVAMAPMVRNGNLIICNSVESSMVRNDTFMKRMISILEIAGNKMIDISSKNEKEEEQIKALVLGGYKNQGEYFDKYKKLNYGDINESYLGPLKTDEYIYANMGAFDYTNYIISSLDNLDLNSLRSFNPSIRYNDPRKEVLEVEKEYITNNIYKMVQSIYYEKNKKTLDLTRIEQIALNEDWFVLVDNKYNVISCIVSDDPRALEEYQEYLSLAEEYTSYYDNDGHIKDDAKYDYKR